MLNTKESLPGDSSIMTYKGHMVTNTLIRCRFSPVETTGQRYIYTGCGYGRVISKYMNELSMFLINTINQDEYPKLKKLGSTVTDPTELKIAGANSGWHSEKQCNLSAICSSVFFVLT